MYRHIIIIEIIDVCTFKSKVYNRVPTSIYLLAFLQGDSAGETSITTNYELQGTGWATRAPVAQTLQTVRQTCPGTAATCL